MACVRLWEALAGIHRSGGRATRAEFWWFILFAALVAGALGALNIATPGGVIALGSSLAAAWAIATLLPTLAVTVRRLRDTGRPWTELFWLLVPIAGLIVLVIYLREPSNAEGAAARAPNLDLVGARRGGRLAWGLTHDHPNGEET